MGREGGRHNRQNAWSHAVPSRRRRVLSNIDNPKGSDCGRKSARAICIIPLFPNGPYISVQNGSSQHITAHHEKCLHGLATQNVSAPPRGMGRYHWGQYQQNTRTHTVPNPGHRVLSIAPIPSRRRFRERESQQCG